MYTVESIPGTPDLEGWKVCDFLNLRVGTRCGAADLQSGLWEISKTDLLMDA